MKYKGCAAGYASAIEIVVKCNDGVQKILTNLYQFLLQGKWKSAGWVLIQGGHLFKNSK